MKSLPMLFLSAAFVLPRAFAQSPTDPTVQALLVEVRQLRVALERSTVMVPKIQMTLQRLQIQQDSAARASRELDLMRSQMAKSAEDQTGLAGEIKRGEELALQEQDAARRKDMESRVAGMKSILEQQAARSSDLRAREVELSSRVRAEQAKLDELNDRLNTLERLLEAPPKQP